MAQLGKCPHFNFHADVVVQRLTKSDEDQEVRAFMVEMKVRCIDCGLPFEFVGMTCGYHCEKPMVDTSAQELRAPIKPKGCLAMPGIPGYEVRLH